MIKSGVDGFGLFAYDKEIITVGIFWIGFINTTID